MCGIAGFIRFTGQESAATLQRLTASLRHRGPDDEGYVLWQDGLTAFSGTDTQSGVNLARFAARATARAGLGFRRLSIQDLSACGHQPMLSDDGQIALTFNGEIFNVSPLRASLEKAGTRFHSASDTEVILRGYERYGIRWIDELAGMFAIALLDARHGNAYLVRDRVGIKPLFFHRTPYGIYWASEAAALADAGIFAPSPDWEGLAANAALQAPVSPRTAFAEIEQVEPGAWWKISLNDGSMTGCRYWRIPHPDSRQHISFEDAVDGFEGLLRETVANYLISDVPVATLISGGLDSTLITALAREQIPVEAFTLSLDGTGKGLDETPQAALAARHLGVRHTIIPFDRGSFLASLPEALARAEGPYLFLEPLDFVAAGLRKASYNVVLDGLGADEVLGGYGHYTNYRRWLRTRWMAPFSGFIPPFHSTLRKVRARMALCDAADFWMHQRVGLKPHEWTELSRKAPNAFENLKSRVPLSTPPAETFFHLDLMHNVGAHHALREDSAYMAQTIEARYPFLDHKLIEWIASLPTGLRYDPRTAKPLVRRLAERHLPPEILRMPKKGFNLPFGGELWDDRPFDALCSTHLASLKKRRLFPARVMDAWWARRREPFFFHRVWWAVTFEAWWRRFIER